VLDRLEASENGRVVISALIMVVLICVVGTTLPLFGVSRALTRPAKPLLRATALDQDWGVFAPDPRPTLLHLDVTLRYRDGSTRRWTPPRGGALVGSLRDYRWRKWAETVVGRWNTSLAPLTGRYVARTSRPGAVEAIVERRVRRLHGLGEPPGPWKVERLTLASEAQP
jgi:hypothetical protein